MSTEIPAIRRFARGDRIYVQAQQIWLILASIVMNRDHSSKEPVTITYGELAVRMGYSDPRAGFALGRQLGIVGQYCNLNDIPALNAIVVNQDTSVPGEHVLLSKSNSVLKEQRLVMKENWFSIRVPTTGTFRKVWESLKE